jgi:hypothetical protein
MCMRNARPGLQAPPIVDTRRPAAEASALQETLGNRLRKGRNNETHFDVMIVLAGDYRGSDFRAATRVVIDPPDSGK